MALTSTLLNRTAPAREAGMSAPLAFALWAALAGGASFAIGLLTMDLGALRQLLTADGGTPALLAFTLGAAMLFAPFAFATALSLTPSQER